MKKTILGVLSVIIFAGSVSCAFAKTAVTKPETAAAIKIYKAGDYTQSYSRFSEIVKKDPSNALAFYYLGMSSIQIGRKDEGIDNYNRAIELSPNGMVGNYAKKGIKCAEDPYSCNATSAAENIDDQEDDKFIKGIFGTGFSEQARGAYERQKIENIKREINRRDDIDPQKFKDYKDFSSQAPTDEEIVTAIRTLQSAGINVFNGMQNYNSDISYLLGSENKSNGSNYEMLNLLLNGKQGDISKLNPQVIQSLMSAQMTANF